MTLKILFKKKKREREREREKCLHFAAYSFYSVKRFYGGKGGNNSFSRRKTINIKQH